MPESEFVRYLIKMARIGDGLFKVASPNAVPFVAGFIELMHNYPTDEAAQRECLTAFAKEHNFKF